MRVQATQRGYYAGKIREAGEVFVISEDVKPGAWMEPIEDGDAAEAPKSKPRPKGQVRDTDVTPPVEPAKATDPVTGDDI